MTNFPGPPTWASVATYTQNQSEVYGSNGFYYICTQSGVSGTTQPTWASVFGTTISDGTVTWIMAQRSRQPWQSSNPYTTGLPLQTSGSIGTVTPAITQVPNAQFIPLGSYVVNTHIPSGTQVIAINASASVVTTTSNATANGVATLQFNQYQYPWADQIVTGAAGSPIAQCIRTGVSGSVQPVWPTTIGASVSDGSAGWATVAIN